VAYDLTRFDVGAMRACARDLRAAAAGAGSFEEAATAVVRELHDAFRDPDGTGQWALVRLFATQPLAALAPDLRRRARALAGAELAPSARCLVLVASAGAEPGWNAPEASRRHRVAPLASDASVRRQPMVASVLAQLGLDVDVVAGPPGPALARLRHRLLGVFHVEHAEGSPLLPDQEGFVRPYGVCSAVGFGGVLPSGEVYELVGFARVPVDRATAQTLRVLDLAARTALVPFALQPATAGAGAAA
jgi:hypothetical protein